MDLIERLNDAWRKLYGDGDEHDVCDTIAEAAAALEAALAERGALQKTLEEIRNRIAMNLAMRPDPVALATMLGALHQIAGIALDQEKDQ